jgi:hypothetical protein
LAAPGYFFSSASKFIFKSLIKVSHQLRRTEKVREDTPKSLFRLLVLQRFEILVHLVPKLARRILLKDMCALLKDVNVLKKQPWRERTSCAMR